jgi:hypothetical protein
MARRNPWLSLGWNAWALGVEASTVIGLRAMKLAAGGAAAEAEAGRMIGEKIDAAVALQTMALSGDLGATPDRAAAKTISHLRRRVRANRRRLCGG